MQHDADPRDEAGPDSFVKVYNCAPTLRWVRLETVPVVGGIGNDVRGVVGQRNERMSL